MTEFKATFDFERFKQFDEPKMLEIELPGYGKKLIDGQKKVIICSKSSYLSKSADLLMDE